MGTCSIRACRRGLKRAFLDYAATQSEGFREFVIEVEAKIRADAGPADRDDNCNIGGRSIFYSAVKSSETHRTPLVGEYNTISQSLKCDSVTVQSVSASNQIVSMLPFYSTLLTSYTYKTKLNAPPRFVLSLQELGKLYANTEYTTEKIGVIQTTCTELERFDKSEWRAEFPFALVKMSCSTQGKDLNSTSTTCYVDGLGVFVDFCR